MNEVLGNTHWTANRKPKTAEAILGLKLLKISEAIARYCIEHDKLFFFEKVDEYMVRDVRGGFPLEDLGSYYNRAYDFLDRYTTFFREWN